MMEILHDESIKKYTTVKVGGMAKELYIPENIDEFKNILDDLPVNERFIIGGGSNLLIDDKKIFKNIINVTSFDKSINHLGNGKYYIGASVRLQKLINTINRDGYGGIEYLYSVPGLLGGAVVMNAGRGKIFGLSISDYIIDVHAYINGETKVIKKEQCRFEYRNSIFKNSDYAILGATLCFDRINETESRKLKVERINLCKEKQDSSGFNFGSVYLESNWRILNFIKKIQVPNENGFAFSKKTPNWLVNNGEGTFDEAIKIMKKVEILHKMIGKKAIPEVIIWQ